MSVAVSYIPNAVGCAQFGTGHNWTGIGGVDENDTDYAGAFINDGNPSKTLRVPFYIGTLDPSLTIEGIKVNFTVRDNVFNNSQFHRVQWYDGTTQIGDDKPPAGTWTGSETVLTAGGASDTWGISGLGPSTFTNADLRLEIETERAGGGNAYSEIDFIELTIYYSDYVTEGRRNAVPFPAKAQRRRLKVRANQLTPVCYLRDATKPAATLTWANDVASGGGGDYTGTLPTTTDHYVTFPVGGTPDLEGDDTMGSSFDGDYDQYGVSIAVWLRSFDCGGTEVWGCYNDPAVNSARLHLRVTPDYKIHYMTLPYDKPWPLTGRADDNYRYTDAQPQIADGKWHYLVFTYEATTEQMDVYIDGESVYSATEGNGINLGVDLTRSPTIGRPAPREHAGDWLFGYYYGDLADLLIVNRPLTAGEAKGLYLAGVRRTQRVKGPGGFRSGRRVTMGG